jgi:hypothetical protein
VQIQIIPGIEPQPEFPVVDLTDMNARMLELMLANTSQVEFGHTTAEQLAWVYRVGHPAVLRACGNIDLSERKFQAVNLGVSAYEAIGMFVHHVPDTLYAVVESNASALAYKFSTDQIVDYFGDARQRFNEEMPKTAEVIHEAALRFYGPIANYAIDGAAMARQFELDAAA